MNKLRACIISELYTINKKFASVVNEIKFRSIVRAQNIGIKRKYKNIGKLIHIHQGRILCDFSEIDHEIAKAENRIEKAREGLSVSPQGEYIENSSGVYKSYPIKDKIEEELNTCGKPRFKADQKTMVAVGKYKNNKKDLHIEDNLNTFFD